VRRVAALVVTIAGALLLGSCSKPLEPSGPVPVAVPASRPPDPIPTPEPPSEPIPTDPAPRVDADPGPGGPLVRVALLAGPRSYALGAEGPWRLLDARGSTVVRARAGESWTVQLSGRRLRATRADGSATPWANGALRQVTDAPGGSVRVAGKRYRGSLTIVASDTGLLVVNGVTLEDYLRGVVPREIGNRGANERAAVEAQAIAARSFTVTRLVTARAGDGRSPDFDFVASVSDQVYGGRDAELPLSDAAVAATRGRVVLLHGRVATAPFHSACGGETAAAEEVWRSDGEPHLRRVSDRIPGSDRYYCDIAPRFAWSRIYSGPELDEVIRRYMSAFASVGRNGPGSVEGISVESRTPSGRVRLLEVRTTTGTYRLRGNDARSVLRSPSGEMLNSPYFSVEAEAGPGGRIARAVIRGNGYGHGVGMCQWGAIGRARAGQDARTILRTYFPGTTIGAIPAGILAP
jgi:stage II sporulation protein D